MDVTEWLRGLGLEQYGPAFRQNDVDSQLLPWLTDQDLRELGIASIGHRRRLLLAMGALRNERADTEKSPSPRPPLAGSDAAERRQLTVVFCDLVGSTALSTALDPEDLRRILDLYHRHVSQIMERFGGFIAKRVGDGVVVLFGYPQAHEDDPERAVRGALALIASITGIEEHNRLQLRIGIATGLVVVGDINDDGGHDVIGDTPNLAARLQSVAQPNGVVIADNTRIQVGAIFEVQDLGTLQLKGFAEAQRVWRVLGVLEHLSRFEAMRSQSTPIVGRLEEMQLLLRRWKQAKAGGGRVILVAGEPGIGKSRLTSALAERVKEELHTRLRFSCSPYSQSSALYPFTVYLERAAGWARDDTTEEKLQKLKQILIPGTRDPEDISLVAELLSMPSPTVNISPQRKREKLFEALFNQIAHLAKERPLLVIIEDAHWIDPTSLELVDLIINRASMISVLLILTFRSEFKHGWSDQPHVTTLTLNRLAVTDGLTLVEQLAGNVKLSRETMMAIIERSDGVPLFIEELTKAILETEDKLKPVASLNHERSSVSIPVSLHASLVARFDRLGPTAKEVVQIGAILGREFTYDLLQRVAHRSLAELRKGLDQLTEAGLLFCRGVVPQSSYTFKHALVQDAAYSILLHTRRREMHARVAVVLRHHFQELIERHPEILAYHLTRAGETYSAIEQWLKAGRHAAAGSAHLEAINHFDRGLAILAPLPKEQARDDLEVELQLARGPSLFTVKGFAAAEAAEAYARARELSEHSGDSRRLFAAINGLWQSANGAGNVIDCRSLSTQLQELAVATGDSSLRLQAHHSAWATYLFAGQPAVARYHCEEGRRLYDPEQHRLQHQLYGGHDPGSCAHYLGAQAEWLLGNADKALKLCDEAVGMAKQGDHPFTFACALQYSSMLHLDRGEVAPALLRLDAAEALVSEQRIGFVLEPNLLRGAALIMAGEIADAVRYLREGLATRLGATRMRCYGLAKLGEALTRQRDYDAALAAARNGLHTAKETGHIQWLSELHRIEGVALCHLGALEEAQTSLRLAARIAQEQGAKAHELRAAISIVQVSAEQHRAAALAILAPILQSFSEGFETADVKQAKALHDQLA